MLSGSEEDTYSMIFASLKHPIRRRILRILSVGSQTFSDLQKMFTIESSHLTYHLEGLGNLLLKTQDGKYALSSLGEAAVSTMKHVEEPPKAILNVRFLPKNWKPIVAAMFVGLLLVSTLLILEHQSLVELSGQYSRFSKEHSVLERALRDYLGGAVVTDEQITNSTVATALLQEEARITIGRYSMNATDFMNVTLGGCVFSYCPENKCFTIIERNAAIFNVTTPWGHNIDAYSLYSLTDNCTLKIEISMNSSRLQTSLYVSIDESWDFPNQTVLSPAESYFHLWDREVTGTTTLSIPLPSERHYVLRIEAPGVWETNDSYETSYTMSLSMEAQGNPVPFIVGNQSEEASTGMFVGGATGAKPLFLSQLPLAFANLNTSVPLLPVSP
jgi:DNA-binding transcriptional ArsR family regulator